MIHERDYGRWSLPTFDYLHEGGLVDVLSGQLRKVRGLRGLTQEELAHHSELTVRTVVRLEAGGVHCNPRLLTIERLALTLGVDPRELFSPLPRR